MRRIGLAMLVALATAGCGYLAPQAIPPEAIPARPFQVTLYQGVHHTFRAVLLDDPDDDITLEIFAVGTSPVGLEPPAAALRRLRDSVHLSEIGEAIRDREGKVRGYLVADLEVFFYRSVFADPDRKKIWVVIIDPSHHGRDGNGGSTGDK